MSFSLLQAPHPTPAPHVLPQVLFRIQRLRIRRTYIRLGIVLSAGVATFACILAQWSTLVLEVQQSSFWQLFRIIFSDPDIALANSQDFALGLLESLPIVSVFFGGITVFLGLSLFLLWTNLREQHRLQLT